MSMFGGYSAALPSQGMGSPIAGNRATTSTKHANSTAFLGTGSSNIVTECAVAIIFAAGILVTARFVLKDIKLG